MKRFGMMLVCLSALSFMGCDDPPPATDAGPIVTVDSGPVGGRDAGPTCPPQQIPGPSGAQLMSCLNSTLTCLMGATTQPTQQACIDADPNAEVCEACITADNLSTATMGGGCGDEFGAIGCCLADNGCTSANDPCANTLLAAGGACASTATNFNSCLMGCSTARTCGISLTTCFMPAGTTDAGPVTTDAGPVATDAGPVATDAGPVDAGPISG